MAKLTGKTRYRLGWMGKLILQVQVELGYVHDLNGSGYFDEGSYTKWRDAKLEDITGSNTPKIQVAS